MKTIEELELEFRKEKSNWPGYSYPLEIKHLKKTDAAVLIPVFKKHGKQIRSYLGSFHNAHAWDMQDAQSFVMNALNRPFPSDTWTFWIGNRVVGIASLEPHAESAQDVQIILAVFGEHQGKGIATGIGKTMRKIAFEVYGYSSFWWLVDQSNVGSIRAAEKLGLDLHHTWTDRVRHSERESGEWRAYWQARDPQLPDGVLQGAPLSYWQETRTSSLLQAVIDARKEKAAKEPEHLEKFHGPNDANGIVAEGNNMWGKAIDQRNQQIRRKTQNLLSATKRKMYKPSLDQRK